MDSLEGRSRFVTVVLGLIILVDITSIYSEWSLISFIYDVSAGMNDDLSQANSIDLQRRIIGIGQVVLSLTCIIAFLSWFHRSYANLIEAGLARLRYSPGWAVGGFFVPFLNLWRPYKVMEEVWCGSAYLSGKTDRTDWRHVDTGSLVKWWWGLFLLSSFLGNLSGRFSIQAEDMNGILGASIVSLVVALVDIPAAYIAIRLIGRITEFQELAKIRVVTE